MHAVTLSSLALFTVIQSTVIMQNEPETGSTYIEIQDPDLKVSFFAVHFRLILELNLVHFRLILTLILVQYCADFWSFSRSSRLIFDTTCESGLLIILFLFFISCCILFLSERDSCSEESVKKCFSKNRPHSRVEFMFVEFGEGKVD